MSLYYSLEWVHIAHFTLMRNSSYYLTPLCHRTICNAEEQERIDRAREQRKCKKIVKDELSRLDLAGK
jgi:hypothetical protein